MTTKKFKLARIALAGAMLLTPAFAAEDQVPVFPPSEAEQKAMVDREKQLCQEASARGDEAGIKDCSRREDQAERKPARDDSWKVRNRAGL